MKPPGHLISFLAISLFVPACTQLCPPTPIAFPPPPAAPRLLYLGRLGEVPIVPAPTGGFRRWLRGETNFLQTPLIRPTGLAADHQRLFVCDAGASSLLVFDYARHALHTVDGLSKPSDVKLDASGRVYVAEAGSGRIRTFDAGLRPLRTIGPPVEGCRPAAIAIDDNCLYVADASFSGGRIRAYDLKSRKWLSSLAPTGHIGQPAGVCLAGNRLWVSDALNAGLFDSTRSFNEWRPAASATGLQRPRHLAADSAGRIFIVDAARGLLQIRDPEGQLLLNVENPDVLRQPVGVCLSTALLHHYANAIRDDRSPQAIVFVADQGPPAAVTVFAYFPGDAQQTQKVGHIFKWNSQRHRVAV